jgi:hypothetical protein
MSKQRFITFNGKTQTVTEWANELKINRNTLFNRLTKNWDTEKTLTTKVRNRHGMTETRIFSTYRNMINRCYNKKVKCYKNYGGRGIKVCDRWHDFQNFYDDIHQSYKEHAQKFGEKNTTIGRIDNDGNYEPGNCEWQTPKEQQNNRNNNFLIKYNKIRKTVYEWSIKTGIKPGTIRYRILHGWSAKEALTFPVRECQKTGIKQLAKKNSIPEWCLRYRIKKGWSIEKALTTPVKKNNKYIKK